MIGNDTTIEDLIDLERYCEAVTCILTENGNGSKAPAFGDLPREGRVLFLKKWCRKMKISEPNKKRVAQNLLDQSYKALVEGKPLNLLDASHVTALIDWGQKLDALFE